jgi:hypothetical protein
MTDAYTRRILDEATATIKRVDKRLSEPRDTGVRYTDPLETHRRDADESDAARKAYKEELRLVERTANAVARIEGETAQLQRDMLEGFRGINALATALVERLEALEAEVKQLKQSKSTEVVELPNQLTLAKRRQAS